MMYLLEQANPKLGDRQLSWLALGRSDPTQWINRKLDRLLIS